MSINNTIFIIVLSYPSFKRIPSRLVIRDNSQEIVEQLNKLLAMNSQLFTVQSIAEYNFKERAHKYYTPEQFLESYTI